MKFEIAHYDVAVQQVSHYATGTLLLLNFLSHYRSEQVKFQTEIKMHRTQTSWNNLDF